MSIKCSDTISNEYHMQRYPSVDSMNLRHALRHNLSMNVIATLPQPNYKVSTQNVTMVVMNVH